MNIIISNGTLIRHGYDEESAYIRSHLLAYAMRLTKKGTPIYLSNVVKRVTGSTVGDHIANCLVRQAKSLLLTTVLSVQEIADRLGFKNQSHFGTFFRRAVGVSPRAFREGK